MMEQQTNRSKRKTTVAAGFGVCGWMGHANNLAFLGELVKQGHAAGRKLAKIKQKAESRKQQGPA